MAGKKTAEFMIVNRRSGKALQATGLDNGLVVEQAEPAKTDAQTWTFLETEGGVKFFNKACGKVLDVMANGTANGTWVQTWGMNFPMAILYQMFYCGPLVRLIFRSLFREKSGQPQAARI